MILTVRTDKPDSEIGLYDVDGAQLVYEIWPAHRRLAETIHKKLNEICSAQNSSLHDITAVIAYKGPGSFTGLRIGLTVANTLAYGLDVPVVAVNGEDWIADGLKRLRIKDTDHAALPDYGADVHITPQKK